MRSIGRVFLCLLVPSSKHSYIMSTRNLALGSSSSSSSDPDTTAKPYVRADGILMGYDPYAPEMAEKYGFPGKTDNEGFNPYADSVGAGIYGGIVKRDASGAVVIGAQYQNHNPNPGPVYLGGGYTPMSKAIHKSPAAVEALLDKYPDLVNDVSTGGASPLHTCGMSKDGQLSTSLLIEKGGAIDALDTYGYTPLHRMASNNLAIGAEALCAAGADFNKRTSRGETPLSVARSSGAGDVMKVIEKYMKAAKTTATK